MKKFKVIVKCYGHFYREYIAEAEDEEEIYDDWSWVDNEVDTWPGGDYVEEIDEITEI